MSLLVRGRGVARKGNPDLEDRFPGRWNPRRPIPPGVRAPAEAVWRATRAAGWTEPDLPGGLVVGTDSQFLGASARFGARLDEDRQTVPPGDFLFALPSSVAALLGLLYGFLDHQATICAGGLSAVRAAEHAADLCRLGRLSRVCLAAFTVVDSELLLRYQEQGLAPADGAPFSLAVAWCLEVDDSRAGPALLGAGVDRDSPAASSRDSALLLPDIPAWLRGGCGPALLAADRALDEEAGSLLVRHRDEMVGDEGWIHLEAGS